MDIVKAAPDGYTLGYGNIVSLAVKRTLPPGLPLFPLETAVHKMTGLTAKTFGLADRGVLKQGFAANIVVFDENGIA